MTFPLTGAWAAYASDGSAEGDSVVGCQLALAGDDEGGCARDAAEVGAFHVGGDPVAPAVGLQVGGESNDIESKPPR